MGVGAEIRADADRWWGMGFGMGRMGLFARAGKMLAALALSGGGLAVVASGTFAGAAQPAGTAPAGSPALHLGQAEPALVAPAPPAPHNPRHDDATSSATPPSPSRTPAVAPLTTTSTTFVVDTTADPTASPATCASGNHTTCSLRSAVAAADADTGHVDIIDVPAGHYLLTPGLGPIVVTNSVHIVGSAAPATVVVDGGHATELLAVSPTGSGTTRFLPSVLIDSMTWTDGTATTGTGTGGDIADTADLVLQDVTVSGGYAATGGDIAVGGVGTLWADAATIIATGATPTTTAFTANGGGLSVARAASAVLSGTTFERDTAFRGGAIANYGTVTSQAATYKADSAVLGGAVFNTLKFTDTSSTYLDDTAGSAAGSSAFGGVLFNRNAATVAHASISTSGAAVGATGTIEGGIFYNDRGLSLTDVAVGGTANLCTAGERCAIYGGVVANAYGTGVPYTGSYTDHTRPTLVVTGLTVTGTENGNGKAMFVAGGVLSNRADATVHELSVTGTADGVLGYVDGGAVFDAPTGSYAADLSLGQSSLDATSVTVTTTVLADLQSAFVRGGAIDLATQADTAVLSSVSVSSTTVTSHGAEVIGGAVDEDTDGGINGLSVSDTSVTATGGQVNGGALFTTGHMGIADVSITATTIDDVGANTGKVVGGGWYETTAVSVTDAQVLGTTVTADKVVTGGALKINDAATITDSTFAGTTVTVTAGGNTAFGGVALLEGKQATLTNVTMDDSTVTVPSGKLAVAVEVATAAQMTNDTIANDTIQAATSGTLAAGSGIVTVFGSALATMENTIVAGTPAALDCAAGPTSTAARVISAGGNIDGGSSCGFSQPSDQSTTAPDVAPVAANGGPVETAALVPGSPAIGHGVSAGAPPTDARGVARPAGDIDVGAFQVSAQGYWEVGGDGAVYNYGAAGNAGSMAGVALTAPVVGIAATPTGKGYWEAAADGGIFNFGTANFYGSMGGHVLNAPIVGVAATPTGKGYWEVAADGGIFTFGAARFYGSMGGHALNAPVVGIVAAPTGKGYWEVAADGGIFAFNATGAHPAAGFYGSMGGHALNAPVVGIAAAPTGKGYWEVAADGGIFVFSATGAHPAAGFYGSMGGHALNARVVGIAGTPSGKGYWEFAADGGIFAFGDATFLGAASGVPPSAPVVGGAALERP